MPSPCGRRPSTITTCLQLTPPWPLWSAEGEDWQVSFILPTDQFGMQTPDFIRHYVTTWVRLSQTRREATRNPRCVWCNGILAGRGHDPGLLSNHGRSYEVCNMAQIRARTQADLQEPLDGES